jgi:hypothetical protein
MSIIMTAEGLDDKSWPVPLPTTSIREDPNEQAGVKWVHEKNV